MVTAVNACQVTAPASTMHHWCGPYQRPMPVGQHDAAPVWARLSSEKINYKEAQHVVTTTDTCQAAISCLHHTLLALPGLASTTFTDGRLGNKVVAEQRLLLPVLPVLILLIDVSSKASLLTCSSSLRVQVITEWCPPSFSPGLVIPVC